MLKKLVLLVLVLSLANAASAAAIWYDHNSPAGVPGDNYWSTPQNWSNDIGPGAADTAFIGYNNTTVNAQVTLNSFEGPIYALFTAFSAQTTPANFTGTLEVVDGGFLKIGVNAAANSVRNNGAIYVRDGGRILHQYGNFFEMAFDNGANPIRPGGSILDIDQGGMVSLSRWLTMGRTVATTTKDCHVTVGGVLEIGMQRAMDAADTAGPGYGNIMWYGTSDANQTITIEDGGVVLISGNAQAMAWQRVGTGQIKSGDAVKTQVQVFYYAESSTGAYDDYTKIFVVPEPMTIALLGLGGLFLRRRK